MYGRTLQKIQQLIREQRYDLTSHAYIEMAKDLFELEDVEAAILSGAIVRRELDPLRGYKYRIDGRATDERPAGLWCRLVELEGEAVLVITVFEVTPLGEGSE